MADLNTVDYSKQESARFEVRHPASGALLTDDASPPKPFYIDFVGRYSDVYMKQQRAVTDRRLKASAGRRKVSVTAEQLESEAAETLARCATGGYLIVDGKEVQNTFEGWYAVFADSRFVWLREAADEFIENESNFTKKS